MQASLPENGSALLAFKVQHHAPSHLRWQAGVVLDDPTSRLAELDGFSDCEANCHKVQAVAAAAAASSALHTAVTPDDYLLPWHTKLQQMLDSHVDEPELPVRILPHLLLSSHDEAINVDLLRCKGVTHVLRLNAAHAPEEEPWQNALLADYAEAGISYSALNTKDEIGYDMRQHLGAARASIRSAREAGGCCLVHCAAGINRSGFIAAAERMLHNEEPVLEAVGYCKHARGTLLDNASFRLQLLEVAREHDLLGPRPG